MSLCAFISVASSASSKLARFAVVVAVPGFLQACASNQNPIDTGLTSAISLAEPAPTIAADPFAPQKGENGGETDRLLDEDTMRLAVTTADLDKLSGNRLPWANAATGASGSVYDITQYEQSGQTCRQFNATRQSYDGVTLYSGVVCLDLRNGWWTRSLAPVQG